MASKSKDERAGKKLNEQRKIQTSIGKSVNTQPKNKHKKRMWKAYKGQGK